jgi:hypothetical protein
LSARAGRRRMLIGYARRSGSDTDSVYEARSMYWHRQTDLSTSGVRAPGAPSHRQRATSRRGIVPAGTVVYEGSVGRQDDCDEGGSMILLGGSNQIYIDRVEPHWVSRD